jgi:hypothetical protein
LSRQTSRARKNRSSLKEVEMAALRIFNLGRSRGALRSAYDETTLPVARPLLSARWSLRSEGRPACRWQA